MKCACTDSYDTTNLDGIHIRSSMNVIKYMGRARSILAQAAHNCSMAGDELRCAFLANHHILVKKLDVEALLPGSISRGLLTLDKQELVTSSQKTDRFLTIIHRRGQQNADVFEELLTTRM